jgi:hypothetical protein
MNRISALIRDSREFSSSFCHVKTEQEGASLKQRASPHQISNLLVLYSGMSQPPEL